MDWRKTKSAVAIGDRRHAMPAANCAVGVPVQWGIIVGVQINRARGNNHARSIQDFGTLIGVDLANFGDLAILDAKVRLVWWDQRSIDNRSAFNDGIKLWHITLLRIKR